MAGTRNNPRLRPWGECFNEMRAKFFQFLRIFINNKMHELYECRERGREWQREICVLCLWDETVQSAGCNYKGKRTIGILCNQWGRDDVNFKYEATFAFDLDAKWSCRKSCLSSAAGSFVFPWCREKHHRNTESLELGTLNLHGINERLTFNLFVFVFISLPLHQWHSSSNHYIKTNNQQSF